MPALGSVAVALYPREVLHYALRSNSLYHGVLGCERGERPCRKGSTAPGLFPNERCTRFAPHAKGLKTPTDGCTVGSPYESLVRNPRRMTGAGLDGHEGNTVGAPYAVLEACATRSRQVNASSHGDAGPRRRYIG